MHINTTINLALWNCIVTLVIELKQRTVYSLLFKKAISIFSFIFKNIYLEHLNDKFITRSDLMILFNLRMYIYAITNLFSYF